MDTIPVYKVVCSVWPDYPCYVETHDLSGLEDTIYSMAGYEEHVGDVSVTFGVVIEKTTLPKSEFDALELWEV